MLYSTPFYVFEPVCMNRLLETIHLLLGFHKWSAQGGVDVFNTHVCVKVGLRELAIVQHTFIFRLAL